MATTDQFGGTAVDAPKTDQFGGTPVGADQFGGTPLPTSKAEEIQDPVSHATQFKEGDPEYEAAFQADQARQNRTLVQKASAAAGTVFSMAPWLEGAKSALKFGTGLVTTPLHAIAEAGLTTAAPILNAVGATDLAQKARNEAQTEAAESTLGGQQIEEGLKRTGHAIANMAPNVGDVSGSMDAMESQGTVDAMTPQERAAHDLQNARAEFSTRVQNAKNAQQVSEGRPLDTGAVAALSRAATGMNPSEAYSPENLLAIGARPISPAMTEQMAAAGDPMNLVLAEAPGLPGARLIAGGATELAGKALQVPMNIAENLAGRAGRFARMAVNPSALGAETVAAAALHPPSAVVTGSLLGAKLAQKFGQVLETQGNEFRTGAPGAFTTSAEAAENTGKSTFIPNLQRTVGNAAVQGAATAYGMAPLNAITSGGNPEQFAQSEVGAGVFGAGFGALHSVPSMRAMDQALQSKLMEAHGQTQFTDNPNYANHEATMDKFSPDDQGRINRIRSFLFGGTNTDVLVVDGPTFAKAIGTDIGQDARGKVSDDGKTIYLNADAIQQGESPGAKTADTAGHEAGHSVVKYLADLSGQADSQGLTQAISSNISEADKSELAKNYYDALEKSTRGVTPENRAAIRQQIESSNPPDKIVEENLAEITRKILSGEDVSKFALSKPLTEKITDAASRMLESLGMSPKIDPNASLAFKARFVKEAARRMQDTLYDVGEQSREKRLAGLTTPELLRSLTKQLAETPKVDPSMPADKAQALFEQRKALQDRIDLTNKILGNEVSKNFPAAGKPPVPPSQPVAPVAPDTGVNRARVAAALRVQGIPKDEAAKWAATANGSSTEEAIVDALKQRANAKFPTAPNPVTQNAPSIPNVSPVTAQSSSASPVAEKVPAAATATAAPAETQVGITAEELKQAGDEAADQAEQAVRDARTARQKPHTLQPAIDAARDKASFEAMAKAHAGTLPKDTDLITMRTDRFGRNAVSGTRLDPSDAFHEELLKRAGLKPEDVSRLDELQEKMGTPIGMEYLSATEAPGAESAISDALKSHQTAELRKQAQAESTAGERAAGQSPVRRVAKSYIPEGITFNRESGTFTVNGFSPDKVIANAAKLIPWLNAKGIETYSGVNDPQLIADLNGYAQNHAAGYLGNGSRPAEGTPLTSVSPQKGYEPYVIPKDRFDLLNALTGDDSAKTVTDNGTEKKGSIEDKMARTEKGVLASQNSPYYNPETGEVNRIRELIGKEGDFKFTTPSGEEHTGPKVLESAWETLRPELIDKIGAPDIANSQTLRPSEFTGNIGDIEGHPRKDFSSSGFMPEPTRPEHFIPGLDDKNAIVEGEAPFLQRFDQLMQKEDKGQLSPDEEHEIDQLHQQVNAEFSGGSKAFLKRYERGAFMPDIGTPEEGETPSERLTREAEQAGVSMSIETLKGLLRGDPAVMSAVRKRIEEKTGKPAQFLPTSPTGQQPTLPIPGLGSASVGTQGETYPQVPQPRFLVNPKLAAQQRLKRRSLETVNQ